jgi:hypothetical protein
MSVIWRVPGIRSQLAVLYTSRAIYWIILVSVSKQSEDGQSLGYNSSGGSIPEHSRPRERVCINNTLMA